MVRAVWVIGWFATALSASAQGWDDGALSDWVASDESAAPVTEENVLESDRFWPYRVAAEESLHLTGTTLTPGLEGVLIRVDASGVARVDFGREGIAEVPVGATDLVERANRVRRGELGKEAPNLAWALGTRLIDSRFDPPKALPFPDVRKALGFLTVYVDPTSAAFDEIARALAPLQGDSSLLVVVIAQGMLTDAGVYARLKDAGWPVPFLVGHLRAPYTRALLGEDLELPAVALQTSEGRVLYESRWSSAAARDLFAAIARAFPDVARSLPSPSRHENATRGTP